MLILFAVGGIPWVTPKYSIIAGFEGTSYCDKFTIEGIDIFFNLKVLRLVGNHIAQIDARNLVNLKSIHIENDDSTIKILTALNNDIEHVYLKNIPMIEFSLTNYPKLKSLYLASMILDSFDAVSNAVIDSIRFANITLPSMIFSFTKIKKLTIVESILAQLTLTNLSMLEELSSINSSIESIILSNIKDAERIDFPYSSVKNLELSDISDVGFINFSNNELQTLSLDRVTNIADGISFVENPLSPETKTYLDSFTDLSILY